MNEWRCNFQDGYKQRERGMCVGGGGIWRVWPWNPEVLMAVQFLRGQLSNAVTTKSAGVVAGVTQTCTQTGWVDTAAGMT